MKIILKPVPIGPWSSTGVTWRAFREDGTPLYIGAETQEACIKKVKEDFAWKGEITFEVSP